MSNQIEEVRAIYRRVLQEQGIDSELIDTIQDGARDLIYPQTKSKLRTIIEDFESRLSRIQAEVYRARSESDPRASQKIGVQAYIKIEDARKTLVDVRSELPPTEFKRLRDGLVEVARELLRTEFGVDLSKKRVKKGLFKR